MELHLVDPVPVAVVGSQDRRVLVREPAPFERLAAELLAECEERLVRPRRPLATHAVEERTVLRDEVVAAKRRRLVLDAGRHEGIVARQRSVVQTRSSPPTSRSNRLLKSSSCAGLYDPSAGPSQPT